MENVWNSIPLQDYELHMQHETVGQLQLLSELTNKYLERVKPNIVIFLGIAGGNGLEHIDNGVTRQVYGIDINQNYLHETKERFKNRIRNLHLINIDISSGEKEKVTKASLIWAALIFEYVETDACFEFINNNIQDNGYLIVTIQDNNGLSSVSKTGIESIKSAGKIFKQISEHELLSGAAKIGFYKVDFEENLLPNGKSLKTYMFGKQKN